MRLKTSSSENRKQPSRLRSSVWVARGEALREIVEHAIVRIQLLILILRKIVGLRVVPELVFAGRQAARVPASSLIKVDLPAPLTPTSAIRSPRSITKFTPLKTCFGAV